MQETSITMNILALHIIQTISTVTLNKNIIRLWMSDVGLLQGLRTTVRYNCACSQSIYKEVCYPGLFRTRGQLLQEGSPQLSQVDQDSRHPLSVVWFRRSFVKLYVPDQIFDGNQCLPDRHLPSHAFLCVIQILVGGVSCTECTCISGNVSVL